MRTRFIFPKAIVHFKFGLAIVRLISFIVSFVTKWKHTWNKFSIMFPSWAISRHQTGNTHIHDHCGLTSKTPYQIHTTIKKEAPYKKKEREEKKIICGFVTCGKFRTHVKHTSKTNMCQSGVLCTQRNRSHKLCGQAVARWVPYQTHTSHFKSGFNSREWNIHRRFLLRTQYWINSCALSNTTCSNKKHAMIIYSHMLLTYMKNGITTTARKKKPSRNIKFILLYAYTIKRKEYDIFKIWKFKKYSDG